MNYDWLFSFVVFSEHLNFTRAAEQLHISQPALHVQISKLSEEVARPLYRRRGRSLILTPEGRQLASFGREVQARGHDTLAQIRGETTTGPVVLASGQGAFHYLLGDAIKKFPKMHWPLRVVSMTGPEAIEAVRDAKADISVAVTDSPPQDLDVTRLRQVGQSVVLPRKHSLARKRRLRPQQLQGERIIVAPAGNPHRNMLTQLFMAAEVEWDVAVETTGWELMMRFVVYGLGITIVNDFCSIPRGLVAVPLQGAPHATYSLLMRKGVRSESTHMLKDLIVRTTQS